MNQSLDEIRFDPWKAAKRDDIPVLDVNIYIVSGAKGRTEYLLSDHLIYMRETDTDGISQIDGQQPFKKQWGAGTFCFLPAGMRAWSTMYVEHDATIVTFKPQRMSSIIEGMIYIDKIGLTAIIAEPDPVMMHCISALKALAMEGNPSDWLITVDSIATVIAARIARCIIGDEFDMIFRPNGLDRRRLVRVVEYVNDNLDRPITLQELAGVAALSQFHFLRSFKRATGMTPREFVWKRRVTRARELLKDPNITLSMAGYTSGFASQSHFSTVFKRLTGVTPGVYRRSLSMPSDA